MTERNECGEPLRMNGVHIDISQEKNLEHRIEKLIHTDELTGLKNRRGFDDYLAKIQSESRRENELFCLLLIGVDSFKRYNDEYGHLAGDKVLSQIGGLLNSILRRNDDGCFRFDGEEFAIVFRAPDKQTAIDLGEKIRTAIENLHIPYAFNKANSPYVTISLGLICDNLHNDLSNKALFQMADDLLYKSKKQGRNRLTCC